jgi:hypothetical protein
MPLPGLSLVGFLKEEKPALHYLEHSCIPPKGFTPQILRKHWSDAQQQLGAPIPKAGTPDIIPIPALIQGYLGGVRTRREYAEAMKGKDWSFQMVEIAPLLAFQVHVLVEHAAKRCADIKDASQISEIVKLCLPQQPEIYHVRPVVSREQGVILKCPSLNVTIGDRGYIQQAPKLQAVAGVLYSAHLPFVEVARFKNRCYLKNGYHRAYGLAKLGVTHLPCVLRDVADYSGTGVRADGATLSPGLLEDQANPPTCGHFVQGRACQVALRKVTKFINVMWSEYLVPDE